MSPKPLGLELNTNARISIDFREGTPAFLVEAPVMGASLSTVRVRAENLPGAHAFLCSVLIDGQDDVRIGAQDAAELQEIGLFAPAHAIPQAVAYRFPMRGPGCPGNALPRHLIDEVNGKSVLHVPVEWPEQELRFEPHHHGSVWAPVMVSGDEVSDADSSAWRSGTPPADAVLDDEATHARFEREGFAILENLLPAEHVREMGRYYQSLAAQGFLFRVDDCGARRHTAHNHPVARFWHEQLNERVSQLVGQRTKPCYSYVSVYISGGDLAWHTDRPPCEYTITLLLDYAPLDNDGRSSWALKLKGRDGTIHALHQRVGEALFFRGQELLHGRDVLPDGHRSASLLFHFVNADYDGPLA